MVDELNQSIDIYQKKWEVMLAERADKDFFKGLRPTAVGWKAQDMADFNRRFAELRDQADQIHFGWINERWIAVLHLKDLRLKLGIELVKLMQRRPDSTDTTGLDHLDYFSPAVAHADDILSKEPGLKWTHEENVHCKWISLWFSDTEAKLRKDTTLNVCIVELKEVNDKLMA